MSDKRAIVEHRDAKNILSLIYSKKSAYWSKKSEEYMVDLFHFTQKNVAAYRHFLKESGVIAPRVKTYNDFQRVPPVTKDGYLRKYPWQEVCVDNALKDETLVLTSTSGSTGKPFYFPRNGKLDYQSSVYHEMFVQSSGIAKNKSTLVIVCFGMGVWIGGLITYQAFKKISERGYPFTIITPGVNKQEIFEALKSIAPHYEQVVLCGYPPFMKDLIDEAPNHGVVWKKLNLKLIFAAEAFSETFRNYIAKKTGITNPYRDTMNIYGSADLGTMAQETPLCILIRRLALKNKKLYASLFTEATRLPTLAQFIPSFVTFEAIGKEVFCSGNNVLPLVRYKIGDNGGVNSFDEVKRKFQEAGIDLMEEIRKVGIEDTVAELPFVYIYERTDFSTKLYGAIIYTEYIKEGLLHPSLEPHVTGKFTIYTRHDKRQNEYLEVNIELKSDVKPHKKLKNHVVERIVETLLEKSAEYKDQYTHAIVPSRIRPVITFWSYNHPVYFSGMTKHKWLKKI